MKEHFEISIVKTKILTMNINIKTSESHGDKYLKENNSNQPTDYQQFTTNSAKMLCRCGKGKHFQPVQTEFDKTDKFGTSATEASQNIEEGEQEGNHTTTTPEYFQP